MASARQNCGLFRRRLIERHALWNREQPIGSNSHLLGHAAVANRAHDLVADLECGDRTADAVDDASDLGPRRKRPWRFRLI